MFKTKLQELCHKSNWALPNYSCVKHGPDHSPLFGASVFVHGVSFDSPVTSKSSKDALNDAAKLAFFHLTTGVKASTVGAEVDMSSHFNSISSDIKAGKQHHLQKLQLQLQQLAQNKNLDPPVYCSKREGPPHALQFQATVTIGGHSFESPGYFKNVKEAEQAASKVALLSLSLDVLHEIDVRSYKKLLQELTQNQGLTLSGYKTVRHGPPHQPTFFSMVEIEGEPFHGEGRKSKKLAELSAAKAAYLLMKRESAGDVELTSCGSTSKEMTISSPRSEPLANPNSQKISKSTSSVGSSSNEGSVGSASESGDKEDDVLMKSFANSKANSLWSSPKKGESDAATLASLDLSSLSITASETKKKVEMGNYLLCNKVRVYTTIPSTKFLEGTVFLPIGEHEWVAVSLEFPNQKFN